MFRRRGGWKQEELARVGKEEEKRRGGWVSQVEAGTRKRRRRLRRVGG